MQALPPNFIESLHSHFPSSIVNTILEGISQPSSVSIRINPSKPIIPDPHWQAVPWHDRGFLLPERPIFALDPRFHAGAFYVQDSSSMILAEIVKKLELPSSPVFLDTCAAPGGKSGILLEHLNGEGFLVANEIDSKRQTVLQENLLKLGYTNYVTTSVDTNHFAASNVQFDLVLVDAPCSGEGMFRKDEFAVSQWSKNLVRQCAATQSKILEHACNCVAEEGYLVYATCTLNPDENEYHIRDIIKNHGFEPALPRLEWDEYLYPIEEDNRVIGYYLLPGKSTGEGLFISVMKRLDGNKQHSTASSSGIKAKKSALSLRSIEGLQAICNMNKLDGLIGIAIGEMVNLTTDHALLYQLGIPFRMIGMPGFTMKGKNLVPAHGLAMMECVETGISLNLEEGLAYLRRETLSLPAETKNGWQIVAFEDRHLGWLKVIEKRTNNYYPSWLKLRI